MVHLVPLSIQIAVCYGCVQIQQKSGECVCVHMCGGNRWRCVMCGLVSVHTHLEHMHVPVHVCTSTCDVAKSVCVHLYGMYTYTSCMCVWCVSAIAICAQQ